MRLLPQSPVVLFCRTFFHNSLKELDFPLNFSVDSDKTLNLHDEEDERIMASMSVYGLKTCDTCRKARNWLQRAGVRHEFIDYREHRIDPETSLFLVMPKHEDQIATIRELVGPVDLRTHRNIHGNVLFTSVVPHATRDSAAAAQRPVVQARIDWGTVLLFGGSLALGRLMFETRLAAALGGTLLRLAGSELNLRPSRPSPISRTCSSARHNRPLVCL